MNKVQEQMGKKCAIQKRIAAVIANEWNSGDVYMPWEQYLRVCQISAEEHGVTERQQEVACRVERLSPEMLNKYNHFKGYYYDTRYMDIIGGAAYSVMAEILKGKYGDVEAAEKAFVKAQEEAAREMRSIMRD